MKEFIVLEFQSDIKASSRAIDFYAVRLIFKKKINNRGRERWERFVKFRKWRVSSENSRVETELFRYQFHYQKFILMTYCAVYCVVSL